MEHNLSWTVLSIDIVNHYQYKNYLQFALCRKHRRGGGVMFLVNQAFSFAALAVQWAVPETCDLIAVENTCNGQCWILAYRPPDCTVDHMTQLFECLENVLSKRKNVIVLGDFNIPTIDWGACSNAINPIAFEFVELWSIWFVASCWWLTSQPEIFLDVVIEAPIALSDHNTVVAQFCNIETNKVKDGQPYFDFSRQIILLLLKS
jgi:hypothetical protein